MLYVMSFLWGLAAGSFANVCIIRLPEEKSLLFPASHCPHCHTILRWRDNIPLMSYLMLQGRCRSCRARISSQYPLVEAAMAVLFLFSAWMFRPHVIKMGIADFLSFNLLTISIIDYRHKIIPDELSLSLLTGGLLLSFWNPFLGLHGVSRPVESLLAALAGGGGMLALAWLGEKMFKKEALGGGDIKYLAALGALLGFPGLVGSLLFGSLLGGAVGITLLLSRIMKKGETLPFGPFLSIGAFLVLTLPPGWITLLFP